MKTSKDIKEEIKKHGIDTKHISIREQKGGYDLAFNVTIKDINIDINEVKKIVAKFEEYERDIDGDILGGGNTFVFVRYDYNMLSNLNKEYNQQILDMINEQINKLDKETQTLWKLGNCGTIVKIGDNIGVYRLGIAYRLCDLNDLGKTTWQSDEWDLAQTLGQAHWLNRVIEGVKSC